MQSNIAEAIKLKNHVVAIIKGDSVPDGALQFKEGVWGCVVSMLAAASKGRVAALCERTTTCVGGKAGVGFKPYELGTIEYFLSVGGKGREGEHYKESPELAKSYVESVPKIDAKEALIFKPLDMVDESEKPESVVFLVNADQLSALVTLANYDRIQDNVQIKFGSGCAQAVLYALKNQENNRDLCTIGLTDPSARKYVDKDLLSFSIPFDRYIEMESKVAGSFLTKGTWQGILKRI